MIICLLAVMLLASTGIAAESPRTGTLNANRVNLRQGPGLNEPVIGMVFKEGTVLEVVAQEGDWVKVNSESGSAWIHGRYLDIAEDESVPEKQAQASQKANEPIAQLTENSQAAPTATGIRTKNEDLDTSQAGFEYKQALGRVMDLVFVYLDSLEQRKDIDPLEKQQKAIEFIRNVRWGPDNKYYFWINDLEGKMIMEPLYPQTEGTNAIKYKDLNNREIFIEFISKSLDQGQTFINHNSLGYDTNWNPRVSLVRLFQAWDWIVGTYVELDDIEAYEEPAELQFIIPLAPIKDNRPASAS